MRILGLEIIKHSRYEWLIREITRLAIENVNLNKDITLAQCELEMYKAKSELMDCINNELQSRKERKSTKRKKKTRHNWNDKK